MPRKKKYFSLIELLIVVAIIAILAGMLLPALNKAREKAHATNCVSRLKTHGTQFSMYINDFNVFPLQSYTVDGTKLYWFNTMSDFLSLQAKPGKYAYAYYLSGAEGSCPSQNTYAKSIGHSPNGNPGYAYNANLNYSYSFPVAKLKTPGRLLVLSDGLSVVKHEWVVKADGTPWNMYFLHNGLANILYGDMHVAPRQYGTFSTSSSGTPFWSLNSAYAGNAD